MQDAVRKPRCLPPWTVAEPSERETVQSAIAALVDESKHPEKEEYRKLKGSKSSGEAVIQNKDMQRLKPEKWLNDAIISYMFGMMSNWQEHKAGKKKEKEKKIMFKNSWFFVNLFDANQRFNDNLYQPEKKKAVIEDLQNNYDKIVIAVNNANIHYVLVVVDLKLECIDYLDSLSTSDSNYRSTVVMDNILKWLHKWCEVPGALEFKKKMPVVPQQDNDTDCGVFALMSAWEETARQDDNEVNCQRVFPNQFRELITLDILDTPPNSSGPYSQTVPPEPAAVAPQLIILLTQSQGPQPPPEAAINLLTQSQESPRSQQYDAEVEERANIMAKAMAATKRDQEDRRAADWVED